MIALLKFRPCRYVSTVHTGKVQFMQNQNLTLELGLWFMSVHALLSLVKRKLSNLVSCLVNDSRRPDPNGMFACVFFNFMVPVCVA